MNRQELEKALNKMTDAEFPEFVKNFGGGFRDRQSVVDAFVHKPNLERRLCQLLELSTEDEKRTQTALDAARSSKRSATAAIISAIIALISLLLTLLSHYWPCY